MPDARITNTNAQPERTMLNNRLGLQQPGKAAAGRARTAKSTAEARARSDKQSVEKWDSDSDSDASDDGDLEM